MNSSDKTRPSLAEDTSSGSSSADVISIEFHLDDLPGTPEDIREIAESVVAALIESPDSRGVTEGDAEELINQIEAQMIDALAAFRFDREVVERVSKSFRPVRETLKGIGRFVRDHGHAG